MAYISNILLALVVCCIAFALANPTPPPLNNNPTFRKISDGVDKMLGSAGYNDENPSKIRGTLHAAYHELQYRRTGNEREHERAKDQWNSGWGGSRDNLKRYDQQHAY